MLRHHFNHICKLTLRCDFPLNCTSIPCIINLLLDSAATACSDRAPLAFEQNEYSLEPAVSQLNGAQRLFASTKLLSTMGNVVKR